MGGGIRVRRLQLGSCIDYPPNCGLPRDLRTVCITRSGGRCFDGSNILCCKPGAGGPGHLFYCPTSGPTIACAVPGGTIFSVKSIGGGRLGALIVPGDMAMCSDALGCVYHNAIFPGLRAVGMRGNDPRISCVHAAFANGIVMCWKRPCNGGRRQSTKSTNEPRLLR